MCAASGVRGVFAGRTYEDLARIGLCIGDVELFRCNAELCAKEYRAGHNPALTARYERLLREAAAEGISISEDQAQAAAFAERPSDRELEAFFSTQLSTCSSPDERLRVVLGVATERASASAGFLYVLRAHGLSLTAVQGTVGVPEGLDAEVEKFWASQSETEDMATETAFDLDEAGAPAMPTLGGLHLMPLFLSDADPTAPRGCGVLVLGRTGARPISFDFRIVTALTRAILEDGSVTSLSLD